MEQSLIQEMQECMKRQAVKNDEKRKHIGLIRERDPKGFRSEMWLWDLERLSKHSNALHEKMSAEEKAKEEAKAKKEAEKAQKAKEKLEKAWKKYYESDLHCAELVIKLNEAKDEDKPAVIAEVKEYRTKLRAEFEADYAKKCA